MRKKDAQFYRNALSNIPPYFVIILIKYRKCPKKCHANLKACFLCKKSSYKLFQSKSKMWEDEANFEQKSESEANVRQNAENEEILHKKCQKWIHMSV